jgi:hypothetical protein
VDRKLSLGAYNHDLKARFFRHKQGGKGGRIGVDDDARRRYLHKAMRRYYHKVMSKPSGLQWLEGQEWRYMSESDGDGDDNGDDVDTTPTTTPTTPTTPTMPTPTTPTPTPPEPQGRRR